MKTSSRPSVQSTTNSLAWLGHILVKSKTPSGHTSGAFKLHGIEAAVIISLDCWKTSTTAFAFVPEIGEWHRFLPLLNLLTNVLCTFCACFWKPLSVYKTQSGEYCQQRRSFGPKSTQRPIRSTPPNCWICKFVSLNHTPGPVATGNPGYTSKRFCGRFETASACSNGLVP